MKKIHYQVLRFLPDRVAGEFINLGLVAYEPEGRNLNAKFIQRVGHIPTTFPSTNSRHLIRAVKNIQEQIKTLASGLATELIFEKIESIENITSSILPKDDTALIFSEVKYTLDINVQAVVQHFFGRLVVRAQELVEDDEVRRDKEVWNKVYRKHFEQQGIASNLTAHTVKTKDDELEFDRAWKNGSWNCFETVSFNLNRPDAIKNKVYKWIGKLDELDKAKEPLHIYLLSVMPHGHPELERFITKKIADKSTTHTHVEIVKEANVQQFTRRIKKQMNIHENKKVKTNTLRKHH